MVLNSQECFTNILNETENHYHEISIVRLDNLSSLYFSHFYQGMLAFWANFGSNWFYQTAAWHNFRVRNDYCYWGLEFLIICGIWLTSGCWKFLVFMPRSSCSQKCYVLICVYKIHSEVYPKGNAQCLKNKYYIHTLCLCKKQWCILMVMASYILV